MNELMEIRTNENQEPIVSGRELHEFLEVGTQYSIWIDRVVEYGFSDGIDYVATNQKRLTAQGNETTFTDHHMKIDMAKEICMIQRSDKGKQARQYFLQIEKEYNSPEKIMARALTIAERTLNNYKQKLEIMAPKAEFFDAVAGSKDAIDIGTAAKALEMGIGRNKMFEVLRNKKVLMEGNIPYQKYIDCGYFRVVEQKYTTPNGETHISFKTLVYQRGLDFIRKTLKEGE